MKHENHFCPYNDGEHSCDCYSEAVDTIKSKIGFLRQYLNERPDQKKLLLNEEIGYWLGLNTQEEVSEVRKRDKEWWKKFGTNKNEIKQ